jgi:hypothetical protein
MIILKLILAHLIGDFVLQTESMVKKKEQKKIFSAQFWYHLLIHAVLYTLFLWDASMWPIVASLTIIHGFIDVSKIYLQTDHNRLFWFFTDQTLHILSIFVVWFLWFNPDLNIVSSIFSPTILVHLFAIVLLTKVTSVMIQHIMSRWTENVLRQPNDSLPLAGKYIGMLERLLIYIFVFVGSWEAIGFLLAAKSVFRFGDLKEANDRKLTEYILLGTLLSFSIATSVSILVSSVMMNDPFNH